MNWRAIKSRFHVIDSAGLSADTVLNLRLIVATVAFGVVWTNVTTGVAMTGFMKELGASDFLYGLVFALPNIANAFQFICSYILERSLKPKRMMLISGLIQRLIWIPIALVPFFIPMAYATLRLWSVVVMALISALMAPFMSVAFYTIASDAIPMRIRGRYFATRSRISTLVGLIIGLVIGLILDKMPGFAGYTLVFTLAGVFGTLDILCYFFMKPAPMKKPVQQSGLWSMMKCVLRDKSYMKTVLAITAFLFAVQFSSPYYNVFMRQTLGVSNFDIILTGQIANNIFLILLVSKWGAAIDHYGNRPALVFAAFLTAVTPLWWLRVSASMLPLVFFANAWTGSSYCAVDLTIQNLFMAQAKTENRSMYFAVYFIFTQLFGLALGSAAGGLFLDTALSGIDQMNIMLGGVLFTRYNALFLISALLRFIVTFALLPRIEEAGAQPTRVMLRAGRVACARGARSLRIGIKRRALWRKYRKNGSCM